MTTKITVHARTCSCERISVDNTNVGALSNLILEDVRKFCSYEDINIGWLLNFATCNSNGAGQVDLAGVEQATEEKNSCGINGPYYLSLVDGVEVVYLNAYITCRTLADENVDLNVVHISKSRALTHTKICLCNLGKGC